MLALHPFKRPNLLGARMRDFERPGRSEAFGLSAMAATSHPSATLAAIDVLRAGGNAVDAAIAAAALLAVIEPTQTGIGGDCFVLLKRTGEPIVAMNGSGPAARAEDADRLLGLGLCELDPESAHVVTVPGAVRAWERLAKDHGTLGWDRLFAPAIAAAEAGYPVTERLARDWGRQIGKLARHPATASVFLPNGASPAVGDIHRQPALGRTLRDIARQGADVFYEGWIAEDIVSTLGKLGGVHTVEDFAAYSPSYVEPISTRYRGFDLWECPPNGSGVTVLAMMSLLDRFDIAKFDPVSVERFHLQAEIARLAYAERDVFVCDPAGGPTPVSRLVSEQRAAALFSRVSPHGRLADLSPLPSPEHRDTTFISIVDRDGTAISFINSIFDDFGTGIVAGKSGVVLHNRGCGFVLDAGHPNRLAGGKRPMHTILPAMLTRNDEVVLSFGVTGGHFQPIGQMQLVSNLLDYGMSVQQAIDAPRMFARGDVFDLESTIPGAIADALRTLGHRPTPAPNPLGTAQAIWIDRERGLLRGGADPRRDGIAIGY